jgi:deoxyribodipyrimidine photo-lyase
MPSTAIVWFRRDLRVRDHPGLVNAVREHDRVVPLFVVDDRLLEGRFPSPSRAAFLASCLRELDGALRERGGRLILRRGDPRRELPALAQDVGARAVYWASDVSPYARARDAAVAEALERAGIEP